MKYWIALGLVATLTACSGNDVSKSDLSKAINEYNRDHPFCVPVQGLLAQQAGNTAHLIKGGLGDDWIHVTVENLDGDDINQAAQKQLQVLTRAGLYEKAGKKEQKALLGSDLKVPVSSYQLTEEGKKQFIRATAQGHALCLGQVKVDKVVWFTEPTPANGVTITQVRYQPEYKLERFAKQLMKEGMPELKDKLEQQDELTATLVRTDQGWRDVRELSMPKP